MQMEYLVVLSTPWYFLHDVHVLVLDHQVVATLFLDSFPLSQHASHLLLKEKPDITSNVSCYHTIELEVVLVVELK